jgi:dihydroneopterin aldolase
MSVPDIIYLRELKVEAVIGVHNWEQQIKQLITLDVELACDIRKAAHSESVSDSIDYADVANKIKQLVVDKKFVLLETLVENIAALLLQAYKINWVRVRANKIAAVQHVKEIGIVIERTRDNA